MKFFLEVWLDAETGDPDPAQRYDCVPSKFGGISSLDLETRTEVHGRLPVRMPGTPDDSFVQRLHSALERAGPKVFKDTWQRYIKACGEIGCEERDEILDEDDESG